MRSVGLTSAASPRARGHRHTNRSDRTESWRAPPRFPPTHSGTARGCAAPDRRATVLRPRHARRRPRRDTPRARRVPSDGQRDPRGPPTHASRLPPDPRAVESSASRSASRRRGRRRCHSPACQAKRAARPANSRFARRSDSVRAQAPTTSNTRAVSHTYVPTRAAAAAMSGVGTGITAWAPGSSLRSATEPDMSATGMVARLRSTSAGGGQQPPPQWPAPAPPAQTWATRWSCTHSGAEAAVG